ncbi:hypothetical protein ACOSQ2_009776 [Xanthoceras sorbifolium]
MDTRSKTNADPTDYDDPSEALTRLRDDIWLDVKVKQPKTLSDTIGVARLIEECNSLYKKANGSNVYRPSNTAPYQRNQPHPNAGLLSPPPIQRVNLTPNNVVRWITGQEAKE